MSLVIALRTAEGIVLASDSRSSINRTENAATGTERHFGIGVIDSVNKTFLAPHNIGIASFGDGSIKGKPIAGHIERFISENLSSGDKKPPLKEVANGLLAHFRALDSPPASHFYIAGYTEVNGSQQQQVWYGQVKGGEAVLAGDSKDLGANWGGETDVLNRLIKPVGLKDSGGYTDLDTFGIPFNHFTLQEAIDFAVYAIQVTEDTMRFQLRPMTVGGPIDVLVIRIDGAEWVSKKTLVARR